MPADDFDDDDDRPRRPRNSRDDDDDLPPRSRRDERDDFDDRPRKPAGGGNGLAITSLVTGIIGIVMVCCCAWIAPPLGIVALITGYMGNSKGQSKGMAIAGMITGGLAVVGGIAIIIIALSNPDLAFDARKFQK